MAFGTGSRSTWPGSVRDRCTGRLRLARENGRKLRRAAVAIAIACLALAAIGSARADSQADAIRRASQSVVSIMIWTAPTANKPSEQFYGSGFVVHPSGLILTNHHVVKDAQSIEVVFSDGSRRSATLCAISHLIDLALVKVPGMGSVPAVTWGDSDKLVPGDGVWAIGNPLDVGESVSAGIVSALHRRTSTNPFDDFIQTDAAINHGNSGGAMINAAGEVVGVNTEFLSAMPNGGALGIGFAIPSFEARHVAQHLASCQQTSPGWIGITVQEVTPGIARALGLPAATGSIVTNVTPGSPAQRAGIQVGDVIETRDGKAAPTPQRLLGMIALTRVGAPVRIGYWRYGRAAEADLIVAPWPGIDPGTRRSMVQAAAMEALGMGGLGVRFADRQGGPGEPRVVVSRIVPGGRAGDAGLQQGDLVVQVDRELASSAELVQSALQEAELKGHHAVLLLVESGGARRWVVIPLGVG